MDKRLEKIENYIRQYHMIEKGDRIVIGVSGGADSVCLLMALCSLQEKLGFQVLVCHVNHELRGEEAAQDEAYVEMLCHKMQVPFFAFHENVELIAKKRKESLEEAGRYVRRQAFEQLCREQGGTKIATAHHSNDNAETMLLNMARGTGLRGLCGIRPVYGKWIRPLLELSREEIEQWLKDCGISYCIDETNQEDEYTRNRIRHHIIPVLEEQVNTRAVEHFVKLSEQAEEIYEYLEKVLHMTIVNSKRIMTVEKVTEIDEKYLHLNVKDYNCVAVVSSQTYNSDGVMFEYTQSRHKPDHFRFYANALRR